MKNKIYIWLDDERIPPAFDDVQVIWCKTYKKVIDLLKKIDFDEAIVYIDFDHDIQCEKTGYDIAKYIVENKIPIEGFYLHTMNPVGAKNIHQLLTHYHYRYLR